MLKYLENDPIFTYLTPTGTTTGSETGRQWLLEQQTMKRVNAFWSGNIAFAHNAPFAWVYDRRTELPVRAYMQDGRFMVPAMLAASLFGMQSQQNYVPAELVAQYSGLHLFFDPRGFVMFSKRENAVDTNDYDSIFKTYHDSFQVIAAIGTLHWRDVEMDETDVQRYRNNWFASLAGKDYIHDARFAAELGTAETEARKYQKALFFGKQNHGPFVDIALNGNPNERQEKGKVSETLRRLCRMAIGWHHGGQTDVRLKDDILKALEYVYHSYTKGIRLKDDTPSWPQYTFNIPHLYSNLLMLLYDEFSSADIRRHTDAIFDRAPDPTLTRGAYVTQKIDPLNFVNRLWATQAFINAAVLAKDTTRINYGMRYINDAFEPSYFDSCDYLPMSPDGFHPDGSLVFHTSHAYNTGYGRSYAIMVTNFLLLSEGTPIDIRRVYNYSNVYGFVEKGMLLFTADNNILKMTTGRHFPNEAYKMLCNVIPIVNRADDSCRQKLAWQLADEIFPYLETYQTMPGLGGWSAGGFIRGIEFDRFYAFLKETGYCYKKKPAQTHVYNAMNKVIHVGTDFKACVAMSSTRIDKFEYFGGEDGKHDWYMNDGALWVYNGDGRQYTKSWLQTADPYFIPGTTVDQTVRTPVITIDTNAGKADNAWAGGVSGGNVGCASMILGNTNVSGLMGKKSWFFFDNAILCIGSGISKGRGNVYTVVDNRMWSESDRLFLDKGELALSAGQQICTVWMNLNDRIGYRSLTGQIFCVEHENTAVPFIKAYFRHGENPSHASYAYLILVGKTAVETGQYDAQQAFEILELSEARHIVKLKQRNVIMGSFFNPGTLDGDIEILTPCQVLLDKDISALYVTDSTASFQPLQFVFPKKYGVKEEVGVKQKGDYVEIDTSENRCGIYKITFYRNEGRIKR